MLCRMYPTLSSQLAPASTPTAKFTSVNTENVNYSSVAMGGLSWPAPLQDITTNTSQPHIIVSPERKLAFGPLSTHDIASDSHQSLRPLPPSYLHDKIDLKNLSNTHNTCVNHNLRACRLCARERPHMSAPVKRLTSNMSSYGLHNVTSETSACSKTKTAPAGMFGDLGGLSPTHAKVMTEAKSVVSEWEYERELALQMKEASLNHNICHDKTNVNKFDIKIDTNSMATKTETGMTEIQHGMIVNAPSTISTDLDENMTNTTSFNIKSATSTATTATTITNTAVGAVRSEKVKYRRKKKKDKGLKKKKNIYANTDVVGLILDSEQEQEQDDFHPQLQLYPLPASTPLHLVRMDEVEAGNNSTKNSDVLVANGVGERSIEMGSVVAASLDVTTELHPVPFQSASTELAAGSDVDAFGLGYGASMENSIGSLGDNALPNVGSISDPAYHPSLIPVSESKIASSGNEGNSHKTCRRSKKEQGQEKDKERQQERENIMNDTNMNRRLKGKDFGSGFGKTTVDRTPKAAVPVQHGRRKVSMKKLKGIPGLTTMAHRRMEAGAPYR